MAGGAAVGGLPGMMVGASLGASADGYINYKGELNAKEL